MKTIAFEILTSIACLLGLTGCPATSGTMVKSPMSQLMAGYGYSLYTPFRTADYPGTVFVLSKNHEGKWTEFPVSGFSDTFTIAPQLPFAPKGKEVGMADVFTKSHDFKASLGFELLSLIVKPELAYSHSENVSIKLTSPKTTHEMSMTRLAEIAGRLNVNTKRVLTDLKEKDQLNYAYIVLETVTVSGIEVEFTLKPGIKASVGLEKLKQLAKLDAKVESSSDNKLTVKYDKPMIVGYKAARIPDTLLSGEVSPMLNLKDVAVSEINVIKAQ